MSKAVIQNEIDRRTRIDGITTIGALCVYGHIEAATFRLSESSVAIKKIKDGVAVSRKKVLSAKLEA